MQKFVQLNKSEKIKNYIETLFLMLNIFLLDSKYYKDYYLSHIIGIIYDKAFYEYTSENYDENYFDFIINYMTKYDISSDDFLYLFLNGLKKDNFKLVFNNLNLSENIGDINDDKTYQKLIKDMYKRKKREKKNVFKNNEEKTKKIKEENDNNNNKNSMNVKINKVEEINNLIMSHSNTSTKREEKKMKENNIDNKEAKDIKNKYFEKGNKDTKIETNNYIKKILIKRKR